jgi:signal transduction histidine kinase
MKNKLNKYIFGFTLVIIASVFLFLTNLIYTLTLDDAKKNHQMQQLEMAKVVAEGTKYFISHLMKDMKLIAGNPAFANSNETEFHSLIDQFRYNYDHSIISSVFIVRSDSGSVYISGKNPPAWSLPELNRLIKDYANSNEYNFFASDVFPENGDNLGSDKNFLLILPLNASFKIKSKSYIAFLVNFDSLIKHFILPLKLNSNDFVWILDSKGRLIYHPRHEEMLFKSINNLKNECLSCHVSFENQLQMVKSSAPAYGEYLVKGDEPSKIFAYVPLELENQRWYIAISTLLPDVVSGLKDRFRLFFILGVFILAALLVFVFMIYYLNLKRIKTEEEKKNIEKISDYQEQLYHSSKLASIGEIVDSVAHEINTPMGIISAHADSIILRDEPGFQYKEELEVIKRQTRRVSDYTRSLLNFSRRMPFQPEELNINHLIEESLYLLNPRLREKKIKVHTNLSEKKIIICGDKRQLEQVFINILNNAIDAVENGGLINIQLRENKKNRFPGNEPAEFLQIKIDDNGSGIKKDELQNIFDPFFTTKKNSGTGLGLSITKSIVQRHKGTISVESKEGKGTSFTITLPKKVSLGNEK